MLDCRLDIQFISECWGRAGREVPTLSESTTLTHEIQQLDDEGLQKRFIALFDDGQGDNARMAFISYCRSRGYHPSDINLLYGSNMFRRLRDMIDRQERLLDEYRAANKFLLEEARRLNGGKMIVPPRPEVVQR